jgi:quercetin dioxygenase-like cupin family protein
MKLEIKKIRSFENKGYKLTPVELKDVAPFEVKRVYTIEFSYGCTTGEHCHKVEQEVFIQLRGSSVMVVDFGKGKENVRLEAGDSIFIPAYVWHGFQDSSEDAFVLALSSTNYTADRSDYIENYEEYLKERDSKL